MEVGQQRPENGNALRPPIWQHPFLLSNRSNLETKRLIVIFHFFGSIRVLVGFFETFVGRFQCIGF